jgi:hypothetical protein
MTHSQIEMKFMLTIERELPALVEVLTRQAKAQERVATQLENLMSFLQGTTIEQVETKRNEMRSKNRKKQTTSNPQREVEVLKDFVDVHTKHGE